MGLVDGGFCWRFEVLRGAGEEDMGVVLIMVARVIEKRAVGFMVGGKVGGGLRCEEEDLNGVGKRLGLDTMTVDSEIHRDGW